ncbi:hypothetical protein C8R47DRAFT_1068049 [Mycena vitilis]|nr:hypothetical protein C8R47DRAFT_1068049 [Mycena vitilis]
MPVPPWDLQGFGLGQRRTCLVNHGESVRFQNEATRREEHENKDKEVTIKKPSKKKLRLGHNTTPHTPLLYVGSRAPLLLRRVRLLVGLNIGGDECGGAPVVALLQVEPHALQSGRCVAVLRRQTGVEVAAQCEQVLPDVARGSRKRRSMNGCPEMRQMARGRDRAGDEAARMEARGGRMRSYRMRDTERRESSHPRKLRQGARWMEAASASRWRRFFVNLRLDSPKPVLALGYILHGEGKFGRRCKWGELG